MNGKFQILAIMFVIAVPFSMRPAAGQQRLQQHGFREFQTIPGYKIMPRYPILNGVWYSQTGGRYEIKQSVGDFEWTTIPRSEKAIGWYVGDRDLVAYIVKNGGVTGVMGRVTQVDAQGKALRIELQNRLILTRTVPNLRRSGRPWGGRR